MERGNKAIILDVFYSLSIYYGFKSNVYFGFVLFWCIDLVNQKANEYVFSWLENMLLRTLFVFFIAPYDRVHKGGGPMLLE